MYSVTAEKTSSSRRVREMEFFLWILGFLEAASCIPACGRMTDSGTSKPRRKTLQQ